MIKEYKDYIKKLEDKIDYYQKLDQKSFLQILKLENKINDYENNFIEYYKYEELQNDYWQLQNCYNYELNKNKEVIK
jgi:hypothetical protein|tara:strand:- start:407 stop:637 length:231 start_codon:yes stop_codon:yes gene_type:complete